MKLIPELRIFNTRNDTRYSGGVRDLKSLKEETSQRASESTRQLEKAFGELEKSLSRVGRANGHGRT